MLDPLVMLTVGITPWVLVNGSGGAMSGLLTLAASPSGLDRMALCVKLKLASLISVGVMLSMPCTT